MQDGGAHNTIDPPGCWSPCQSDRTPGSASGQDLKPHQLPTRQQLIDPYNRHLNYLRISITDRCNLRCGYCVPRGGIKKVPHDEILRYEEILRVVRIGVGLGITKLRITGGEPLVRKGVSAFLAQLGTISGLDDIALTTNGVNLKNQLEAIKLAGISRLNISIDSLQAEKFARITGRDAFHRVWAGIMAALDDGFDPIKLNIVALNGINDDEFLDFAKLTLSYPFQVRFIEYMPIGSAGIDQSRQILAEAIEARLAPLGKLEPIARSMADGPAVRYRIAGAVGEIGFIRPISHHFCHQCNRLRLTAGGQLRACLLSDHQQDIKTALRSGCLDRDIEEIFLNVIRHKPSRHNLICHQNHQVAGQMSAIGG